MHSCKEILFNLKKEVLTSMWINLEDITLGDVSQSQKDS